MMARLLLALALAACPAPAPAQAPAPLAQESAPQPAVKFLPRASLRLAAEHLSGDDPRYVWDADVGGELDLIEYRAGRAMFAVVYEVMLGEELKAFDPNQGNYTLAGSLSRRVGRFELSGVFHHVSRHLSDRDKRVPVDWNMVGGRLQTARAWRRLQSDVRVDLRGVVQKSFVDYRWELDAAVRNRYPLHRRVAVVGSTGVRVLGVDGSRSRGTQAGGRAEGGIRIDGEAGAVELFLGAERRIDPHQLEFSTETWFVAGFRLLSR